MENGWVKVKSCGLITDLDKEFISLMNNHLMVCVSYFHTDSANAKEWKRITTRKDSRTDEWYEKNCIIVEHINKSIEKAFNMFNILDHCSEKYGTKISAGCGNMGYQTQINPGILTRAVYKLIDNEWYVLPHPSVIQTLSKAYNL